MKKLFSMGIVLSTLMLLVSSCKKDNNGNNSQNPEVPRNDINLSTSATFGKYLSNKQGLTLYMFANDADSVSSCTGGCETIWPPFSADLTAATLDAGLTAADFATI